MSSAKAAAILTGPHPGAVVGPENPYPGIDGATTWNASAGSPPCAAGSDSGPMTLTNSKIDPGQPWTSRSGMAAGFGERAWMRWRC